MKPMACGTKATRSSGLRTTIGLTRGSVVPRVGLTAKGSCSGNDAGKGVGFMAATVHPSADGSGRSVWKPVQYQAHAPAVDGWWPARMSLMPEDCR